MSVPETNIPAGLSLDAAVTKHLENRPGGEQPPGEGEPGAAVPPDGLPDGAADDVTVGDTGALEDQTEEAEGLLEEGAESPSWNSFGELAEAAGMDLDAFMTSVKHSIDGEEVPLRQLIQGYRAGRAVTKDREALSKGLAEFEAERQQTAEKWAETAQKADVAASIIGNLAEAQKQAIQAKYAQVDWNALRQQNQGEFVALSMEYSQELQTIDAHRDAVLSQIGEGLQVLHAQREEARAELRGKAEAGFRAAFSLDEGDVGAARGKLAEYVRGRWPTSTDADLEGLWTDPRIAIAFEESRRYRELQAKRAAIKPRNIEPLTRGGVPLGGDTAKARAVKAAKAKLRETGQMDDAIELALARRR